MAECIATGSQRTGDKRFLPPPTHPSRRGLTSTSPSPLTLSPSPSGLDTSPVPSSASSSTEGSSRLPGSLGDPVPSATSRPAIIPSAPTPTESEEDLTETELRELYDEEEIERFLRFFSAYVREVQAVDDLNAEVAMHKAREDDEGDCTHRAPSPGDSGEASPPPIAERTQSFTEWITQHYVLPLLPPPRPTPPKFTVHRLQLTLQRLYLSTVPVFTSFASRLLALATWKNWRKSFAYYIAYWILWYNNLLLPSFFLAVLYHILRRKLLPYPTLAELRERRREVDHAVSFGTSVANLLVSSSNVEVRDIWQVFRETRHVRRLRETARLSNARPLEGMVATGPQERSQGAIDSSERQERALEDAGVKRNLLLCLSEVVDLLERTRNIFLWRQPVASLKYGSIVLALCLLSLLPAQYFVKLFGFVSGALFWHVAPVYAAIPASHRNRYPTLLSDVPTDAKYALELISQRIARGLEVRPRNRRRMKRSNASADDSTTGPNESHYEDSRERETRHVNVTSVDWKKVGDRVAEAKGTFTGVKAVLSDGRWKRVDSWAMLNPLAPKIALPSGNLEPRVQAHTYPAQLGTTPGLITLTASELIFTPLHSTKSKMAIPVTDITGLKKPGLMKGINVRWKEVGESGLGEERDARFVWVGDRDELFARLVGLGGQQWLTS